MVTDFIREDRIIIIQKIRDGYTQKRLIVENLLKKRQLREKRSMRILGDMGSHERCI